MPRRCLSVDRNALNFLTGCKAPQVTVLPPLAVRNLSSRAIASTMATPEVKASNTTIDYTTSSPTDLIARITSLEAQLRATNVQLAATLNSKSQRSSSAASTTTRKAPRPTKPFDPTRFSTRLIALKISYMGQHYNGYEHANGTVPPKPTIEEVLWKALRKARLISPPTSDGADESTEVVWDAEERLARYAIAGEGDVTDKKRLELNWEGCQYSKCGRTDRGVSAFGQVVGVRVRSNAPREPASHTEEEHAVQINGDNSISNSSTSSVDPVRSELPYLSILNSILPPTIRVLAWCPTPPSDFDARFSCQERRYKYFFTNPAFLPTPGPLGMRFADGRAAPVREGWLDVDAMRVAAKKLEGLHDFRNLCKIDPSKQMGSCERRIGHADVRLWEGDGAEVTRSGGLSVDGVEGWGTLARKMGIGEMVDEGPKVFVFEVHGSAFLWHQVRCMVAMLFLVGQGLERPEVVDELLDIGRNPRRPMYEMADDGPLVLWDCVFEKVEDGGRGGLDWIYAGDEVAMPALTTKHDTKFGMGGLADTLWSQWRKAKLEETVTGGLLDAVLKQGDGTPLLRGGFRDPTKAQRSQKVFDGGDAARVVGAYTPVANKAKMDTLEVQNEKYRIGRGARRDARSTPVSTDG